MLRVLLILLLLLFASQDFGLFSKKIGYMNNSFNFELKNGQIKVVKLFIIIF